MNYLLALLIAITSSLAWGQAAKTIPNRGLDQDLKLCVNDGGVEKCGLEIDGATGAAKLLGTSTNDNAAAGQIGEYIEDEKTTSTTGSTSSGVYTDAGVSITLTPGDWDIIAKGTLYASGGNGTGVVGRIGDTYIAEDTDSDVGTQTLLDGQRAIFINADNATTTGAFEFTYRVSISTSKIYWIRFVTINNSGSPTLGNFILDAAGVRPTRLSARRVR